MCMYFYNTAKVHLVFEKWDPQTNGSYFGYLILVFLVAFACESLCVIQSTIETQTTVMLKNTRQLQVAGRIGQAIITLAQVLTSFFVMLAVMTFNAGVFMAAVLGLTASYVILGFKPTRVRLTHNYFLNNKDEPNSCDPDNCCMEGVQQPTNQSGSNMY